MRSVVRTLLLLTFLPASFLQAQSDSANYPSDLQLRVRVRDGQTTFRIGEIIHLDLEFTSTSKDKYQLDTATYDRSGRLNAEEFAIQPGTGWDDPLSVYFHSYGAFMGGGLRGFAVLSSKPTEIHLELNEWVRFNAPGHYRLVVSSCRVSRTRSPFGTPGFKVRSNEVNLTIVPASKDWQESTLNKAINILDSSKPNPGPPGPTDSRWQGVKTLRYLGTVGAAQEMARRLIGDDWAWDFEAGLIGSPARTAALDEMKKLLVDPNFPVTDSFLGTMSILALPDATAEGLPDKREAAEKEFREQLTAVIDQKKGKARAISNNAIVEDAAIRSRDLSPDLKRKLTAQLVVSFDKLPVQKQAELLQYRWSALDHEEMLPLLRRVATRYQDFPQLRASDAFEFNNASAAALTHWYEIDPAEARPIVIQEILRPKPRFDAHVLGLLPDKDLPEADEALAEHLRSQPDFEVRSNIASLIHRYGTAAIEPEVLGYLDPVLGRGECAVQEALLAYLIKVDPEAARPRVETAVAARSPGNGCYHSVVPEVARLQNHPMLQEIALKGLDDSDSQVVLDAARYLIDYGSASAEDSLWAHFIAWSERWKGHEAELQYSPGRGLDGQYQSGAGTNLMMALATGHGWLADEPKLRRLIDLSIGPNQRQQVESYLRLWQTRPWTIDFIPYSSGQFQVAQYHANSLKGLEEKLLQFPPHSVFQWQGSGVEDKAMKSSEAKAFHELSQFAADHSFKLVDAKPSS
jgi:hypothetical protein